MREREAIHAENRRLRALLREHADWHAGSDEYDQSRMGIETDAILSAKPGETDVEFQARVAPWMRACFDSKIAGDIEERCDRFIEEALELTHALGHDRERAHALVDYVYEKDGGAAGEPSQEVGGTMVTLAALCLAAGLDLHAAAETELARVSAPEVMAKIRAKQAAKPVGAALPVAFGQTGMALALIRTERREQIAKHGYTAAHDEQYVHGEIARAAACYALAGSRYNSTHHHEIDKLWPWTVFQWRPRSRVKNLIRAGALIAAELERLAGEGRSIDPEARP